jgi:hypothetical protein
LGADPYLAGAGGGLITRGTQAEGVIATPKVSLSRCLLCLLTLTGR